MKIVAINGSPRKNGNTAQVLEVVRREVEAAGVEFQVFQPGAKVHPCMACYHCLNTGSLRCVQTDGYGQRHHRRLHRGGRHPAGSSGVSRRYFRQYEVRAGPADAGGGLRGESAPPQGGGAPCAPCAAAAAWRRISSCWAPWMPWRWSSSPPTTGAPYTARTPARP